MRDVELVSELFLLTMHGVLDGAAAVLDSYYAQYDEEVPDEDEEREHFDAILGWLEQVPIDWRATRWRNMNDLYSLWGALRELLIEAGDLPELDEAGERLTCFSETQSSILAAERENRNLPGSEADRRYFSNVRQGGNKDTNRQVRVDILVELLSE